jgi:hypothetical protein
MTIPTNIPKKSSGSYKAARLIYDTGSKTDAELAGAIHFGSPTNFKLSLDRAIKTGWLQRLLDGRIALTDFSIDFFDTEPVKRKGQIAAPRIIDVMNRKPYSTPKRMVRDDVPKWSVRSGVTLFTKA